MRVVLLDPDPASRTVIANWVDEFFAHVAIEPTGSAAQALRAIENRCPDLVLAAQPLSALDGIALAALIKARPIPPVVVVFTTGCAACPDLPGAGADVDLLLERRHLQSRLLAFLQGRFPKAWADGVAARMRAVAPGR